MTKWRAALSVAHCPGAVHKSSQAKKKKKMLNFSWLFFFPPLLLKKPQVSPHGQSVSSQFSNYELKIGSLKSTHLVKPKQWSFHPKRREGREEASSIHSFTILCSINFPSMLNQSLFLIFPVFPLCRLNQAHPVFTAALISYWLLLALSIQQQQNSLLKFNVKSN